ncbi:cupin-like domain-containing protein [Nonomuraea sp. NPDC050556]|uniref:cupin-like domain-containing protein n=1 Tax=Nonomuraea sp. NPDC050556 TaxID=3364369 RepID=UPI0037957F40
MDARLLERFWPEFYARNIPVVVTGGMDEWAAMGMWTPSYFRDLLVGMEHPLRETDDEIEYAFVNHTKRVMSVSDYIDALDKELLEGSRQPYFGNIPIASPDTTCWFAPIRDHFAFPDVLRDRVGEELRLWIGGRGQRSTIHNDSNHGFNAQVYGRKTFVLFPPEEHQYLYTMRISDDTWVSQVEWADPDLSVHPEYSKATGMEVTLEVGEMLYIPAFWWHSARAESVAININIWIFTPDIGKWIQ